MQKKILLIGSSSNLGRKILCEKSKYKFLTPSSTKVDILNISKIENYIKKNKPLYILHLAGLSDPMTQHKKKIGESIKKNIIGTANLSLIANKFNIKLIYTSTNFVYPGDKGNFSESDSLLPFNNYGWSKLGGESSVMMLKKFLIIRLCLAKSPYKHKIAFTNYTTSFLSDKNVAKTILLLLKKSGVINVGGKTQSAYNYAINEGYNVIGKKMRVGNSYEIGINTSINTKKLKILLKS